MKDDGKMVLTLSAAERASVLNFKTSEAFDAADDAGRAMAISSAVRALWEYAKKHDLVGLIEEEWIRDAGGRPVEVCQRCGSSYWVNGACEDCGRKFTQGGVA